jgi:hypothetical protein
MNDSNICDNLIKKGMIFRYIVTIIGFCILILIVNYKFIKNNIYIILTVLLILIDSTDNKLYIYNNLNNNTQLNCTHLFNYQCLDKICDSFSYLLSYIFLCLYFKTDSILLIFILYRIIGVILFSITRNSIWLVVFFDFIKEYFIYLFIFNNNYVYIPLFILCKICFEYYWHKIKNNANYSLEQSNLETVYDDYAEKVNN